MLSVAFIFVAGELLTAMLLFLSRYLILQGYNGLPLKWVWLIVAAFLLMADTFFVIWRTEANTTKSVSYLTEVSCGVTK